MKSRVVPVAAFVAAIATLFVLHSCALKGSARHNAVLGNVALYESLAAVQDTADTLVTTGTITREQRSEIAVHLLPALQTGRALARVIKTWPDGEKPPSELFALYSEVNKLVDAVLGHWPDTDGKAKIASVLARAQQAILVIAIYFAGR